MSSEWEVFVRVFFSVVFNSGIYLLCIKQAPRNGYCIRTCFIEHSNLSTLKFLKGSVCVTTYIPVDNYMHVHCIFYEDSFLGTALQCTLSSFLHYMLCNLCLILIIASYA